MRKVITLVCLTVFLSIFSGSLLAAKYEQCEVLKSGGYTNGLYGLCNSYWKAVEKGKHEDKALDKYRSKMNEGDPDMPGLTDTDPDPDPDPVTCPCLDALAVINEEDWGMVVSCFNDGSYDDGFFVVPETNLTTIFATDNDGVSGICSIQQSPDTIITLDTTMDEYNVCLSELLLRCSG